MIAINGEALAIVYVLVSTEEFVLHHTNDLTLTMID